MKKTNQGITLVALVITIIILLILAGITISQLTGSGLFENAKLAEEKSKNAQEKEDGILSDYENKIGEYVDGSREDKQNSGIQDTVLWEGSISAEGETATLSDSIENYKYLLLETKWSDRKAVNNTWLNVSTIKATGYFATDYSIVNSHTLISMYGTNYIYIAFTSNNSIVVADKGGSFTHFLTKVIGIK